jgi:hypothetical protein
MQSRTGLFTAALLAIIAAPISGNAQTRPPEQKPAIDPQAIAALERMGAYLRTQAAMKVDVEMATDDVLPNGQKVEFGGTGTSPAMRARK